MTDGIIFAILAAFVFGLWTIFHQQASNYINALLGAIIVSLTAVILGLVILFSKIKITSLDANPKGILFSVLAGIYALGIDYFALKAYGSGLQISVAGPIIIGGSIATASIIGFFLRDSVSLLKILGLLLVVGGSAILVAFGK